MRTSSHPVFRTLFALGTVALVASASPALAAEKAFPVGAFDRIVVGGSADVDVRTGRALSVVATGDAADLDRLDIRVDGTTLVIGTKPGKWSWGSRKPVRIAVDARSIEGATVSGSGDLAVDRVAGPFEGRVSGSGDIRLPSLAATTLLLSVSGSGNATAAGTCSSGDLSVSGSGNVDAGRLTCRTIAVKVSGSGNVDARATGSADLRASGSGNIGLAGGARCTSKSTGSGSIRCS